MHGKRQFRQRSTDFGRPTSTLRFLVVLGFVHDWESLASTHELQGSHTLGLYMPTSDYSSPEAQISDREQAAESVKRSLSAFQIEKTFFECYNVLELVGRRSRNYP